MPKFLVSNGLRVHYARVGTGPDLVMIHGLTGNLAVWHLKIIPMISHRFRVLTYDLRGHGWTDMTPGGYSGDGMADDLLNMLDELGIERPSLVGHSYGADIALYFAHRYPERVREVIAIEAALPAMVHMRIRDEWEGWAYWVEQLERAGHSVPPERRSDFDYLIRTSLKLPRKFGPLRGLPRKEEPFLRLLDETSLVADYEQIGSLTLDRIPDISTRVLLMYGEGSAFLGTHDYLYEHLPNVESIILPRTDWGHFEVLAQGEAVAENIIASLAEPELPEAVGE